MGKPDITIGIIVFNGMPFLPYCIEQWDNIAKEVVVVEGSTLWSKACARIDGHSSDGTLEFLKDVIKDKPYIKLITAEDYGSRDGTWKGEKNQMCSSFVDHVTGEWLWLVDVDEFYLEDTVHRILDILKSEDISGISMVLKTFWGSPYIQVVGRYVSDLEWGGSARRIFKWEKGYRYITHRPPTVVDCNGVDITTLNWITPQEALKHNLWCFHYPFLFHSQVVWKLTYYSNAPFGYPEYIPIWFEKAWEKLTDPFNVHPGYKAYSWLVPYYGDVPAVIKRMWDKVKDDSSLVRRMDDVKTLLKDPFYRFVIYIMRLMPTNSEIRYKRGSFHLYNICVFFLKLFQTYWRYKSKGI